MTTRIRVPQNVSGDFYVEDGCCTRCEVIVGEAPGHFAFSEKSCYVCRQPETPAEVGKMISAMTVQEFDCIRYGGTQRQIQIRLHAAGLADYCDHSLSDSPNIEE